MDEFLQSAIDSLDQGAYHPEAGQRPGMDSLPDGIYDFEIVDASLDRTKQTGQPIFRLGCKILTSPQPALIGLVVERASILSSAENMNRLGGDLLALGIDSDQWGDTKGRPLSRELPKACFKLPTIRFRGKKHTAPGTDRKTGQPKTWHNLDILSRIATASPSSMASGLANGAPPASRPGPAPVAMTPANEDAF